MFKGLLKKNKKFPRITFATCVWEKDYRQILGEDDYLKTKMIANHNFPFQEKILIINNVDDFDHAYSLAKKRVDQGILTKIYHTKDDHEDVMDFFWLTKDKFKAYEKLKKENKNTDDNWVYYNALGPLSAIYHCNTEFLLYHTGDTRLLKKSDWIDDAICAMERNRRYKVANLNWKEGTDIIKESYKKKGKFYISKKGFSDQLFLVRTEDFKRPIYSKIRSDARHYPRGETFEKRVFSHMANNKWLRLTHTDQFYLSKNLY